MSASYVGVIGETACAASAVIVVKWYVDLARDDGVSSVFGDRVVVRTRRPDRGVCLFCLGFLAFFFDTIF